MTLKTISTGSDGNSFVLTNDNSKHLLIEAGLPIGQIKKGLDFDIANLQGVIVSHEHLDHSLSVRKLKSMGIKTYTPYKFAEIKRARVKIGDFTIESFPVPHNGVENRGFIITVDGQKICYLCDLEYCPFDLSKQDINILICECNYISDLVDDSLPNIVHKTLGHCELSTTIGIINNCKKHLRKVVLVHMSKGVTFNKQVALERIKSEIPKFIEVEYAEENKVSDLSEIPF